jgi:hypothetical protein
MTRLAAARGSQAAAAGEPRAAGASVHGRGENDRLVTVVRRADCAHGQQAVAAVTRLAHRLGLPLQVRDVVIRTEEEARSTRCLGSPTVLVAGRDVEPAARERTAFGLT